VVLEVTASCQAISDFVRQEHATDTRSSAVLNRWFSGHFVPTLAAACHTLPPYQTDLGGNGLLKSAQRLGQPLGLVYTIGQLFVLYVVWSLP
jgi:hypothetical protein